MRLPATRNAAEGFAALLALVGVKVKDPASCIPDYVVMVLIVAVFLALFLGLAARRRKVVPGKLQNVLEVIIAAVEGLEGHGRTIGNEQADVSDLAAAYTAVSRSLRFRRSQSSDSDSESP